MINKSTRKPLPLLVVSTHGIYLRRNVSEFGPESGSMYEGPFSVGKGT